MPKTHVEGGPSYAGHVDTSSPDTATPEWQPVGDPSAVEIPATVTEPIPAVELGPEPVTNLAEAVSRPRRRKTS